MLHFDNTLPSWLTTLSFLFYTTYLQYLYFQSLKIRSIWLRMLGLYYSPHWIFDIFWIHMFTYVWFLLVQVGWRGAGREERVIMFLHFLPDHFRAQDIIINIWYSSFYFFVLFLLLEPRTFISSLLRKINLHPGKQHTVISFSWRIVAA